jgi:MFS family permease
MSLPDFLLEASRVLIGLGLAVFIGVPLALLVGSLEEERFGREQLGRARFMAAGALLVGVLLEVQVMGGSLPPRHVWRAGVLFLLVASLVYSVMVVAPKARYYDERSSALEENLRAAWHARRDAARARGSKIDLFGFLLALAALVLG